MKLSKLTTLVFVLATILYSPKVDAQNVPNILELCTGQKIEKKLAKITERGFHRKLPHNQRNPYEPD